MTKLNLWRMNMKRLMTIISFVLGLALFTGAQSAQAAHPKIVPPQKNCTLYSGSVGGSYWPYVPSGQGYMYYCGGATLQHAQLVFSVIAANNNANFITTQMRNNGGIFFLYPNATDYYNDLKSQGAKEAPATAYSITLETNNVPLFSAIFENNSTGAISNTQMQTSTAHELGHWLDFLDASIFGSSVPASASTFFTNSLTGGAGSDWYVFNKLAPCNSANTGLFNGDPAGQQNPFKADSNNKPPYAYYCNGTTGTGAALLVPGSSNEQIVEAAYSNIFKNGNGNQEEFAEELAVQLGYRNDGSGTTVFDWDHFMDPGVNPSLFACT
jgi:hypothetical protein